MHLYIYKNLHTYIYLYADAVERWIFKSRICIKNAKNMREQWRANKIDVVKWSPTPLVPHPTMLPSALLYIVYFLIRIDLHWLFSIIARFAFTFPFSFISWAYSKAFVFENEIRIHVFLNVLFRRTPVFFLNSTHMYIHNYKNTLGKRENWI